MMSSSARHALSLDLLKRKPETRPSLHHASDHTSTIEWLSGFLGTEGLKRAQLQLSEANAGEIDGEVLLGFASKEDLRKDCGLDLTLSTKIWRQLQELQRQQGPCSGASSQHLNSAHKPGTGSTPSAALASAPVIPPDILEAAAVAAAAAVASPAKADEDEPAFEEMQVDDLSEEFQPEEHDDAEEETSFSPPSALQMMTRQRAKASKSPTAASQRDMPDQFAPHQQLEEMDDEDEAEDVIQPKPIEQQPFLLPPAVSEAAASGIHGDMVYRHDSKGVPGLTQMIDTFSRHQLMCLVRIMELDEHACSTKEGRKRDKRTGVWQPVERKRSDADLVKLLLSKGFLNTARVYGEVQMRKALTTMVQDESVAEGMTSYLSSYFAAFPTVREDKSNLADVIMNMWQSSQDPPIPKMVFLGTRMLSLNAYHATNKAGVLTKGKLSTLYKHLEAEEVRLNEFKHTNKAEDMEWLLNAVKATENQLAGQYVITKHLRPTRYECEITFLLKRQEVYGGDGSLLAVLQGLTEYCTSEQLLDACEALEEDFEDKAKALGRTGISELPQGAEGLISLGELEGMLEPMERRTFKDPHNGLTASHLKSKIKLKLKKYQMNALNHHLEEENNSGTSRHLWVELPVAYVQPYFVPAEDDPDDEEDEDKFIENLMTQCERPAKPSKAAAAEARASRASRRRPEAGPSSAKPDEEDGSQPSAMDDDFEEGGSQPSPVRPLPAPRPRAPNEIAPTIRLFISPVLNAMYWGSSLRSMQQGVGNKQLSVSPMRGGLLWLEMGMGKTAVMISLMTMPRPPTWASTMETPDKYCDTDTYDGELGFAPRVLHKAKTLVVVCNTLVCQWQSEIRKFTGSGPNCGLNVKVFFGKERRLLMPKELGDYDVIIATPDGLSNQKTLQSVLWERIIVDEAHQQPGLMQVVQQFPAMAKYCVTGTPYNDKTMDISKMLAVLGMPSFNLLSKNCHHMGYLLERVAVRYTALGKLDGEVNLKLPQLTETEKLVEWSAKDVRRFSRLEEKIIDDLDCYLDGIDRKRQLKEQNDSYGITNKMCVSEYNVQNWVVTNSYLMPLRQACSGGIPVLVPHSNDNGDSDEDDACVDSDDEETELEAGHWIFESKINALIKEVDHIIQTDTKAKILIFSCFQNCLTRINKVMSKRGFHFRTIDSGMTMHRKGAALEAFQTDPPTTIFLLNANVATVGLTLTAANYIILVEPSLNPAQERQAIGRAYRMGQLRPVNVLRLAMKDTVEQRIWDLLKKRKEAGKLREMDMSACGSVAITEKGAAKGKGRAVAGRRLPSKKAMKNLALDTAGFERTAAIDELCWLMKVERRQPLNRRLDMGAVVVKTEKMEQD